MHNGGLKPVSVKVTDSYRHGYGRCLAPRRGGLPVAILAAVIALAMPGCGRRDGVHRASRTLMGTEVTITMTGDGRSSVAAAEKAFDEIRRVERLMSPKKCDSDVARINAGAAAAPVVVSPETFEVLETSMNVSRQSGGSLDITFAALEGLWNIRDPDFSPPADGRIRALLPLVNYRRVLLDPRTRSVRFAAPGMRIGLGALAKGYAVGRAAAALRGAGIRNAIVEAGGDLQALGRHAGRPWIIGLRNPRGKGMLLSLGLADGESVATSGDYERFAERGGRKYHHLIDPRTGRPARTFASVSVVASDPLHADAWATAFFIMGEERARAVLRGRSDLSVVLVGLDGKIRASSRLKRKITDCNDAIEWF